LNLERCLLVPQRFDGIQIRSFFRWIETEKDADGAGVFRRTDDGQTEEGSQTEKRPESETPRELDFRFVAACGSGKIVFNIVSDPAVP